MRKLLLPALFGVVGSAFAADAPLFFREDFTETPPSIPLTQRDIANPELVVSRHGPGGTVIKKSHHDRIPNDPHYVWSGLCPGPWALTLRKRGETVDLRDGRVRWKSRQSGFRQLRVVIQDGSGRWMVSDAADGASDEWRVREVDFAGIRWRELNIETVIEGAWVDNPDLERVFEIGFTDLMRGGRTPASSRVDWIEVYGAGSPTGK